ncbi:MAG: sulfurtransferase [Planctomycetota bacterium]
MTDYANTDVLVTTDWVKQHMDDASIKLVEVDVDTKAYDAGHIPGSVGFNWETELQDQVSRDILSKEDFERLIGGAGIAPGDTVVLYGDHNNWFAAYAFWLFKLYGHEDVRMMNGGRQKWLDEDDKPLTVDPTPLTPKAYEAKDADLSLRARVMDVLKIVEAGDHNLVDVRSTDEFTGKVIAPPGMSETAQRGGHIPGAASVPWASAVQSDGTFKSADDLRAIYFDGAGVDAGKPTVAYCRIGERSSHTWFVLKYLLGLENVRNYDGSWTEYGSMVGVPIERGTAHARKAEPATA